MANCLRCQQRIIVELTPRFIFSWQPLRTEHICRRCLAEFELIGDRHCPDCGRAQTTKRRCQDCQKWHAYYRQTTFSNQACFKYNGAMKDYFQRYKGLGDYRLRQLFAAELATVLKRYQYACFVPIPTAAAHLAQRGFDPVLGLYGELVPLTTLLTKRPTKTGQADKNRQERLATPQFFDLDATQCLPDCRQIVLLDDIYTTGRTLWHAYDCLRPIAGNCSITSVTLAR